MSRGRVFITGFQMLFCLSTQTGHYSSASSRKPRLHHQNCWTCDLIIPFFQGKLACLSWFPLSLSLSGVTQRAHVKSAHTLGCLTGEECWGCGIYFSFFEVGTKPACCLNGRDELVFPSSSLHFSIRCYCFNSNRCFSPRIILLNCWVLGDSSSLHCPQIFFLF